MTKKRDVNTIIGEIRDKKIKKAKIANEISLGLATLCTDMRILTIIIPSVSTKKLVERVYSSKDKAIEARKSLLFEQGRQYAGIISRPTNEFVVELVSSGAVIDDMSPLLFEMVVNVVRCDDDGDFDNYFLYPTDVSKCVTALKELIGDHPSFSISTSRCLVAKKEPKQEVEDIINEIKSSID